LIIILSILMLVVWERNAKWLQALWHWPSIALALLIILPWYIAIWQVTGGQFFTDAIGQDLAPKLSGQSENMSVPPGAHLLISPLIMWPGSILIPAAIWAGWCFRKDPRVRFLLAWAIPGWILFEAAPAKLAHYTLPVHGAILLLGAIGLLAGGWRRAWVKYVGISFVALGGLVLAAVPVALASDIAPSALSRANIVSLMIAGCALGAVIVCLFFSRWAGPALAASAVIVSVAIKGLFVPSLSALNVSARVSEALESANLHPRLSAGKPAPLIGFGYQEPSLIFLTRSDSALSSVEAATKAARIGSGVVIAQESYIALSDALKTRNLSLKRVDAPMIAGINYSKGDPVELIIAKVVAAPSDPSAGS
jgi:4-amino-4-deoxy-L-arabinose transferase-like glycosyltransferase